MNIFGGARRNGKSEAIRQAMELADRMGCTAVVAQLYGIQTAEDRANAKAIDVEFHVVEEPKGLLADVSEATHRSTPTNHQG